MLENPGRSGGLLEEKACSLLSRCVFCVCRTENMSSKKAVLDKAMCIFRVKCQGNVLIFNLSGLAEVGVPVFNGLLCHLVYNITHMLS